MLHPLQYELETTRHTDYQQRAAQQRLVGEAEHIAAGQAAPAAVVRKAGARIRSSIGHALRKEMLRHAAN